MVDGGAPTSDGGALPAALTLDVEAVAPLRRPVLAIALAGWFDVAEVATGALATAVTTGSVVTVGEIDADRFFDFTVQRPDVELDDEGEPTIVWPHASVRLRRSVAERDVITLVGHEPHLDWHGFVECVLAVVDRLGVELVVSLGAASDATPHTRTPTVVGSTTDAELAARYGLAAPSYQGITGLAGVLLAALDSRAIPSVSLRVGVPHYLTAGQHPRAVATLLQHLAHVIDVALPADLNEQITEWDELHDQVVADDPTVARYVRTLEREHDRRAEATLAGGAHALADQVERFLRQAGDHPADDDPTGDDTEQTG